MGGNTKSLSLSFDAPKTGPGDIPLIIGTLDTPGVVKGVVCFDTNYDCKGDDIIIEYKASARAKWQTKSGNTTYRYDGTFLYDNQHIQMALPHSKPGKVTAGKYLCPFSFTVDSKNCPSSFTGTYGWLTYRVKVTLVRSFPSINVVREQKIWVLNSVLPKPTKALADATPKFTAFKGTVGTTIPYICLIPSDILYVGQQVPITIKLLNSTINVRVVSAVIKLKQYTTLKVKSGKKDSTKEIMTIDVSGGWPEPQAKKNWQRTIVVPMPTPPKVTPSMSSNMITKAHNLKLIMEVMIGDNKRHELRVEMPVTITGPRPDGEAFPSFDLHPYLAFVDKL
ncbi:hypothetical protein BGZ76_007069 [Entomortierella beljakovae]|nr:hypothetical protein BGZ76_007069 [Entomortierella beljakovae]